MQVPEQLHQAQPSRVAERGPASGTSSKGHPCTVSFLQGPDEKSRGKSITKYCVKDQRQIKNKQRTNNKEQNITLIYPPKQNRRLITEHISCRCSHLLVNRMHLHLTALNNLEHFKQVQMLVQKSDTYSVPQRSYHDQGYV